MPFFAELLAGALDRGDHHEASFAVFRPGQSAGRPTRLSVTLGPEHQVYLGLPTHTPSAGHRAGPGQAGRTGLTSARVNARRAGMVGFMVLAQRKVLILAADDFEDMELLYPLYRLVEEDVEVTVAGLDHHPVRGKKGHGPVPVDTTVGQVAEGDFDALVIPGGYAPDKLRRSETVLGLVRAFDDAKKPIAFICHAGWVPISAKILKGHRPPAWARSATTWSTRAPTGWTRPPWSTAT